MQIEEILHGGGTPKDRSQRGAELAGKRLLRKQFPDVGRKLIVDRVADRPDGEKINGPLTADLGHGKGLHVDRQGIVLAAQLLLLLAKTDYAIEGE